MCIRDRATVANWLSLGTETGLTWSQGSFKKLLTGGCYCSPLHRYQKPRPHTQTQNIYTDINTFLCLKIQTNMETERRVSYISWLHCVVLYTVTNKIHLRSLNNHVFFSHIGHSDFQNHIYVIEEAHVVDSSDWLMHPAHESANNIIYFSWSQDIMISVSIAVILFHF